MRPVRLRLCPAEAFESAHSPTLACMCSKHLRCRQQSRHLLLHCRVANELRVMRGRSRVEAMQLDLSNFR